MKKLKVVIASVLAGSGHNSAGDLMAQLLSKDGRFEVIRYTHPTKLVDTSYNAVTKFSPFLFNFFVNHNIRLGSDIVLLSSIYFVSQAVEVLRKYEPDIVIATQFTVCQSFKIAEIITGKSPVTFMTHLDYGVQPGNMVSFNIFARADYALIYEQLSLKSYYKISHHNKKNVILTGHTCRDEFKKTKILFPEKAQARVALKKLFSKPPYNQLSTTKTTIMIAGGGGGIIQKTFKLLRVIAAEQKNNIGLIEKFQFIIICGQNHKYLNKIMKVRSTKLSWQNIFPVGWLNAEMYATIQRASDFPVLFGIAPATMHELLESECGPLIIHKVRAVHEMQNVDFVIRNKLGVFEPKINKIVERIFKPASELRQQRFLNAAHALLAEELALIMAFPDKIIDIDPEHYISRPLKTFKVPWYQVVASVFITGFTIAFYYITLVGIWANKLFGKIKGGFARFTNMLGFNK